MKLITSCFSWATFKNDIKRFKWISILFFIVLFFNLPIQLIDTIRRINEMTKYNVNNYFNESLKWVFTNNDFYSMLIFGISILLPILLFRYLHTEKSTTNIHSLPVTRTQMYNSHFLAGIVLILTPVILIGMTCIGIINSTDSYKYLNDFSIINWIIQSSLLILVIYSLSMMFGVISGQSISQGAISFILCFLPIGLGIMIMHSAGIWLYGYQYTRSNERILENISPGFLTTNFNDANWETYQFVTFISLSIIFYIIGLVLYKIRNNEEATNVIAFPVLKSIFKYCVTFCGMILLGTALFYEVSIFDKSKLWLAIGYIFGASLTYFIIEMLNQKSVKIKKSAFKGYFIYMFVFTIIMVGISYDLFGYVNRVPQIADIKGVYFNEEHYMEEKEINWIDNNESIESIQKFHKQILSDKKINDKKEKLTNQNLVESVQDFVEPDNNQFINVNIKYKLNNNRIMRRVYSINRNDYYEYLKEIFEANGYKESYFDVFNTDVNRIDKIRLNAYGVDKELTISNRQEINEFINILKQELLNVTYEQKIEDLYWADISILYNDTEMTRLNYSFQKDYYLLEKWLKEKDYIKFIRIMPEDVEYATVEKTEYTENKKQSNILISQKITDKVLIEKLLVSCGNGNYRNYNDSVAYRVRFNLGDDSTKYYDISTEKMMTVTDILYL